MRVAAIAHVGPPPDHDREVTRLFEVHSEWLYRYCLRQLGSPVDAEDAVQTTFLHVLRALQRDVTPECEEAWLTVIARNVCHTHRRTLGRRGALAGEVDLDAIAGRPTNDGDEDLLVGLRDALASLPESQRRALVLREWHGVPSREIASRLRLSAPATHALLGRARRSLAHALTVPRPAAGFDLTWLLSKLEVPLRLLGTGMSKATAFTLAAGIVAGGVVLERQTPPPSRDDREPLSIVRPTGNTSMQSNRSHAQVPERTRGGSMERRSVVSRTTVDRTSEVSRPTQPNVAPTPAPTVDGPQSPRTASAPEGDAPAPPTTGMQPPLLEPPSVADPQVPALEPSGLLPPLPLPPLPDPLAEPPAVPASPDPGLPLP